MYIYFKCIVAPIAEKAEADAEINAEAIQVSTKKARREEKRAKMKKRKQKKSN